MKVTSKIITEYIYPPIANRSHDWIATRDNGDEDSYIGYGATEKEAIANLIDMEQTYGN